MDNINLDLLTIKNSWTVCDCKYCTDNDIDYFHTCIFFLEIQKISKLLKNINNLKNISFNNLDINFKPSNVLSKKIVINILSYLFKLLESIKESNKKCIVCCSTFEIIFLCKNIFLLDSKFKNSITERLDYIINQLNNNTITYQEFLNASKILNPFCKFKENLQLSNNCNSTIFVRLFNRNTIIYKFNHIITFTDLVKMLLDDNKIKSNYKVIGGYKGQQLLENTLLINQIDDFNVPIYIV
jgi:hypothetical protein